MPHRSLRLHRAFYAVFLSSNAALLPLIGVRFAKMGADPLAIGALMAALPAGRLVAAPLWAWIADRWRLGGALLRVSAISSAIAGIAVQHLDSLWGIGAAMFAFSVARAPSSAILDGFVLRDLERAGEPPSAYGRVRMWGSVGFLAGILLATALHGTPGAAILADGTLLASAALSLAYPWQGGGTPAPIGPAWRALAAQPFLKPLLLAGLFQGWCVSTYDSFYSVHVEALGLPVGVVGASIVVGVCAEIGWMAWSKSLFQRWGPARMLLLATLASVPRWALISVVRDPVALTAMQVLHGLSFGAFWLSGVERLARSTPAPIRASAQALWTATTYGLGAWIGAQVAGAVQGYGGTPMIFEVLTGVALFAAGCALWLERADATPAPVPAPPATR
jgi:PPP family 3-phenylpropionic acid transporter